MTPGGYPETWPEFFRMLIRDKQRRRNFALLVLGMAGIMVLVLVILAGGIWVMTH